MKNSRRDAAKFWHESFFGGMDLLRAHFVHHAFARHTHDEFVIALNEQGTERLAVKGSTSTIRAGSLVIIPPGVVHTGSAATSAGWGYRAFYPSESTLLQLGQDLFRSRGSWSAFPFRVISDPLLLQQLVEAHAACESRAPVLERQERLTAGLARILRYLRADCCTLRPAGKERVAVRRAKECLEARFAEEVDTVELSRVTGLSPSYLVRAFRRETGIPPHAYLTQIRLRHARRMILAGESASLVALAVGFVDQSHFIRRFKKAFGVSPGRYARESKKVQ